MSGKRIFSFDNIACTIFIFVMMALINMVPISGDIVDPIAEAFRDVEVTDVVFSKLRDAEPVPEEKNIVIVNFGSLPRSGIAEQINIINKYEPKVIGIDAVMRSKKSPEGDSLLAAAFASVKNLVLAARLENDTYDEITGIYDSITTPIPEFSRNAHLAFVNLPSTARFQEDVKIGRYVNPQLKCRNTTYQAFGLKIAELFNKEKSDVCIKRNNEHEVINFRGNIADPNSYTRTQDNARYTVLDVNDVLEENFTPDLIKDKIVIFGYLGEELGDPAWEDRWYTPMNEHIAGRSNPDMFGIVVHANIISMILQEDYIDEVPSYISVLIAIVLCFLNVVFFSWLHKNYDNLYDTVSKITQIAQAIILTGVLVYAFFIYDIKLNLTIAIVSVALVGDFLEIYYGVIKALAMRVKNKITQLGNKVLIKN
jgi:CHASE2 domain-containing sensor protein